VTIKQVNVHGFNEKKYWMKHNIIMDRDNMVQSILTHRHLWRMIEGLRLIAEQQHEQEK
jgi:hypothetical protein